MDQGLGSGTRAEENGVRKERRLDLNVPQVAGSALAAVAAAVLASRLGVYGTIIGAGVVSVVATCGGSVFQHLFRRTGEQLREATVQAARQGGRRTPRAARREPDAPDPAGADGEFGRATTHGTRVRGWKRPVVAAAVVFGAAMAGITGYELISGQDLSGGAGTTVGSVVGGGAARSVPHPDPAVTSSPEPGRERTPDATATPGGAGTDASASPDAGPSTGSGQDSGATDPSPTPTPAATGSDTSGSGGGTPSAGSTPTPTASDASGGATADGDSGATTGQDTGTGTSGGR
ncbi:hypothetical protein ACIOWG_06325 [Streptomyces sp. NPDC087658]|uniref:hypothetical protein n=1 Tax=Streptomyces sp. NPDC087658 TaxID=3365800 RepID=UPI0038308244